MAIANVTNISLKEYLELDEFWQEALLQSVNHFINEQNKAQKKSLEDLQTKIQDLKGYQSPLANMQRPSFIQ